MKGDFSQLYSRVGLLQDCSLAEFQRAYRRRIATLHPDKARAGLGASGPDELSELIHLYRTATRFHRRHGRLPGASAARSVPPLSAGASPPHSRAATAFTAAIQRPQATPAAVEPAGVQRSVRFASLVVVSVILLAVAMAWEPPAETSIPVPAVGPDPPAMPMETDDFAPLARHPRLQLGMDQARVLDIQGKPVSVNGDRWDYGPSWIRFENNRLVDWHNSPLHPLKISGVSADSPGR